MTWTTARSATCGASIALRWRSATARALPELPSALGIEEPVTQSAHDDQVARAPWVRFDLLAQALDMRVESLAITVVVGTPHGRDQLGPGEEAAAAAQHELEQAELLGRKYRERPPHPDLVVRDVHLDRSGNQDFCVDVPGARTPALAPQLVGDAMSELPHREGLDQEFVCSGLEGVGAAAVRDRWSDEDDRGGGRRPHGPTRFEPVGARARGFQQHQGGPLGG